MSMKCILQYVLWSFCLSVTCIAVTQADRWMDIIAYTALEVKIDENHNVGLRRRTRVFVVTDVGSTIIIW